MASAFKCPNCGAALEVTAGRTDVTCATCGTVTNLSTLLERMSYVEMPPPPPDRMGPLNLFLLANRVGGCGCVVALAMACIVIAIIFFAISSVQGGFSGYLTQAAR